MFALHPIENAKTHQAETHQYECKLRAAPRVGRQTPKRQKRERRLGFALGVADAVTTTRLSVALSVAGA